MKCHIYTTLNLTIETDTNSRSWRSWSGWIFADFERRLLLRIFYSFRSGFCNRFGWRFGWVFAIITYHWYDSLLLFFFRLIFVFFFLFWSFRRCCRSCGGRGDVLLSIVITNTGVGRRCTKSNSKEEYLNIYL